MMASDEAWERGHKVARLPIWVGAAAAIVAGLSSLFLPTFAANIAVLVGVSIFLAMVLVGSFLAVRVAREVPPPGSEDYIDAAHY